MKKRKRYFSYLDMNNSTVYNKFWNTVKPSFSNYDGGSQKITIGQDDKIISNDE